MKMFQTLFITVIATASLLSSCKKKDDPSPTAPNFSGTFTVNDVVQTPITATRYVYTASGITFTQIVVQNNSYNLTMEFTNADLDNGDYMIKLMNPSSTNREVDITFTDRTTNTTSLTTTSYANIVKVSSGNITFDKFTFKTSPMISLAGNFMVKK
jgi:major membrane immunogen (membrane-anchored lipoprotein)